MGLVGLVLLYAGTAVLLAALARRLGRPAPPWAALVLALAPLALTGAGFLPGRTLAPTRSLLGVAPWCDSNLVQPAGQGSSPANSLLQDLLVQINPWREAARRDLLFNPAQGAGAALLGNGQSAVLHPLEMVARLLPPPRAPTYSQAGRLLLAVWGMFFLARSLGLSPTAATVSALAFLGSGWIQLWRGHPHTLVAAAAPWVLAALFALVRRPGGRTAAALGVAGALAVYGGHPETLFHVLLFGLLAVIPSAARNLVSHHRGPGNWGPGRARVLGRVALAGTAAALLAFLLAAPALLPLFENLPQSAEWSDRVSGKEPSPIEVPWHRAVRRLYPSVYLLVFGNPVDGNWKGPENLAEVGGGALGSTALVLAGVSFARRRRRREAAGWLLLGLLGLAVAAHLPWISRPFGWIEPLRLSLLSRLTLWWALSGSLLAGFGFEALRRRKAIGPAAAAAGFVTAGIALLAATIPTAAAPSALLAEGSGLVVALATVWILKSRSTAPSQIPSLTLRAGLRCAQDDTREAAREDIEGAAREEGAGNESPTAGHLSTVIPSAARDLGEGAPHPRREISRPALALLVLGLIAPRAAYFSRWIPVANSLSYYPETPAVAFVRQHAAGFRVAGLDAALIPHSAALFDLEEVRAYDPMTYAPYDHFMDALVGESRAAWTRVYDPAHPVLAFLGVRFIFDQPESSERPGTRVIYAGRDALVHENPRALPRLFAPTEILVVEGEEAALSALSARGDWGRFAAVQATAGLPPGAQDAGGAQIHELTVGRRRISARVHAQRESTLASSQPAIPGWRLFVDGVAAAPLRINAAFLGARVPAGEHLVELVFQPRSFELGVALAAAGTLLLLVAATREARQRRARRGRARAQTPRTSAAHR